MTMRFFSLRAPRSIGSKSGEAIGNTCCCGRTQVGAQPAGFKTGTFAAASALLDAEEHQ
jgi:hypothetical protein